MRTKKRGPALARGAHRQSYRSRNFTTKAQKRRLLKLQAIKFYCDGRLPFDRVTRLFRRHHLAEL